MSQSWKSYSGQLGLASCLAIGAALSFGAVDCVFAQMVQYKLTHRKSTQVAG
ncbi:MAG: hypothetical protein PUP93_34080 [Rhizonema sp. NSF051]|nr:hypothetical protein [Rhizonema sp. NSF051]